MRKVRAIWENGAFVLGSALMQRISGFPIWSTGHLLNGHSVVDWVEVVVFIVIFVLRQKSAQEKSLHELLVSKCAVEG